MKLKVGDKVKLQYFESNEHIGFVKDMYNFVGKITKIKSITSGGNYYVKGNTWGWINLKKINSIQSKLK